VRIQIADVQATAVQSIPSPSIAKGASAPPLLAGTLGDNLRTMAERCPRSPAVVDAARGVNLRYRGLLRESGRVARALMAKGVEPGDRVGVLASNRYEWILLQFAAARIGAILVGLDPRYGLADLESALRQSGTQYLFAAAVFRKRDLVATVRRIRDRCPELEQVTILESGWQQLLGFCRRVSGADLERRESTVHPVSPANIQFTTGTDGRLMAVTTSHCNLLNAGFLIGERLGYSRRDRICVAAPLFRSTGMALAVLAATTHGACLVVPREATDVEGVLACLSRARCTSLHAGEESFLELLPTDGSDDLDLPSLRSGLLTGSVSSMAAVEEIPQRLRLSEFVQVFGLAEAAVIACRSDFSAPRAARSGGRSAQLLDRVAPHTEIRIVEPRSCAVLPCGSEGELCVRGYSVMLGYWIDPQTTLSKVEPDGWLHTGVRARLDVQGRLWLADPNRATARDRPRSGA